VVLSIFAVFRGLSFAIPRVAWPSFAGLSLATFMVSIGYLVSVHFIPVGLAVLILFTFPVIVLLSAPIIEGHRPGFFRVATAIFAFAGLAVAIGPGFEGLDPRGIALAAMGSLGAAMQLYFGRAIGKHLDPAAFGSLVHLAIALPCLLVVLWLGGGVFRSFGGEVSAAGLAWALALSLAYVGAYFFHMQSVGYASASVVAPFFNLEPIVTTLIAVLLLGERLALNQYAGGTMILAALIASSILGMKRQSPG
jgi:drug/metabolite transporter (DMT)-like permease